MFCPVLPRSSAGRTKNYNSESSNYRGIVRIPLLCAVEEIFTDISTFADILDSVLLVFAGENVTTIVAKYPI